MNIDPVQHLSRFERPSTRQKAPGEPRSERDELISKFVEKINLGRIGTRWRPIKPGVVAIRLANSGLKAASDLHWFFQECERAPNFSATFFSRTDPKKATKPAAV